MDIDTTPATDLVAESEGFDRSDLTKLALTAAGTIAAVYMGKRVMRRVAVKLIARADKLVAEQEVVETIVVTPETVQV